MSGTPEATVAGPMDGSASAGPPVKCLVWDLDNTLWRGTLLEGDQVVLDPRTRELIVRLDSRGILQSVASKNDEDLAWAELEALGVAEYFVLPEIGWGPKSESVRRIAEGLRFAPSAMAFVDDQPAERAEVQHRLPEVRCYDAAELNRIADRPEFSPTVTDDARQRRRMYQAGFQRDAARAGFTGPDEAFLRSLGIVLQIRRADAGQLSRVSELTVRTSQMNATGMPYSDADLLALCDDDGHEVLVVSMTDRFGSHGAVGVILLERHPARWRLKLLATSCRVVSYGAGAAILNWLIDAAATAGVHLAGDFRSTERNRMMDIAYRFAGFEESDCACLAGLGDPDGPPGLQHLHLRPGPRPAPATMRLETPALFGGRP
jgi:methoxymalonate biosynthesis protein